MLALSVPVAAPSGFAPVQHTFVIGAGGGANVTTPAIDTTGANLIVISTGNHLNAVAAGSITDSFGNTYLAAGGAAVNYGGDSRIFYCYAPIVGAGHTFTFGGSNYGAMQVTAWSGAAASPLDQSSGGWLDSSVSSYASPPITPTANGELVIAATMIDNASSGPGYASVSGGFVISDSHATASGLSIPGAQAWLIQATAGAAGPTWTYTGASGATNLGTIASFKHS
jgi:hypothetical protein